MTTKNSEHSSLLIFFPYFSIESFLLERDRSNWEIISVTDFLRKGSIGMLRYLRSEKWRHVAIGKPNWNAVEARYFLELIALLARAHERFFVDNANDVQRINYGAFFFIKTPQIILEGLLAVSAIVASYCYLTFLRILYLFPRKKFRRSESKRVAYLRTDDFGTIGVGGSFTHVEGFCNGIIQAGWKIVCLAPAPLMKPRPQIEFHSVPYPKKINMPELPEILYGIRFFFKALRLLRARRPPFIYHRHSDFHASTPLLARVLGIPLIMEYNGSEVWVKEKWGKLFLRNLCGFFEKTALKGADKIGVVSQVLLEELLAMGIARGKIILNPNGVDPTQFNPHVDGQRVREKYKLHGKKVIGFIGSFGPWHGVDVLVETVKTALEQTPDLHFLIIGDGALRPYIEKHIHEDNVAHHVTLTGTIPHEESPEYLAACDILVSPHVQNSDGTRFFGSPTKLFEYMAMEKPIIASRLEQIADVLEDKKTALLVTPGSRQELAAAIALLAKDADLCKSLGANARKTVLEKYTWELNAKRILKSYENCTAPYST